MNFPGSLLLLVVTAVTTEGACGSELAQLVSHHVLGYVNGNKLVTIVYCDSVTYEVGRNHRGARPSLHNSLLTTLVHSVNLLLELDTDVRTFF